MTDPRHTRDTPTLLRVTPPLEVKLAGNEADNGILTGLASSFGGQPDAYGDVISRQAYSATLADHLKAGTTPIMLWSHAMSEVIGRWTELRETDEGLHVVGKLNLNTTRGREAFEHLKAKDVNGLSIGFRIRPDGYKLQDNGTRLITALDLVEISVVALPAAPLARVHEVKSLGSRQELVDFLRHSGLPLAAAKKVAGGGWSALASGEDDDAKFAALARRVDRALLEIRSLKG